MQELHRTGGSGHSTLEGLTQGLVHTRTQGKGSDFIGAWAGPTCWSWRVSWGGRVWLWLSLRTWTLVVETLGSVQLCECQGGRYLAWVISTKTGPYPTACRLQYCDTSGQTTNRAGAQPHPSADRLPKDFLSPQQPIDT